MDTMFHGDLVASRRILYTPSAFARESLLHLQEIGELQARKPHTSRRSNLPSHLFCMVVSGDGILEYEGERHALKAGDCFWVDCRLPYAHSCDQNLWKLQWIHFAGPCLDSVYAKYLERGGACVFTPEKSDAFGTVWQEAYQLAGSSDYIRDMRINECLTHLITLLMAQSWHPESRRSASAKKDCARSIKEYIDQNFRETIYLDNLAEMLFINKFYMTRIFRARFGLSINSYLTQVRITHAKHLLRFSDLPMTAIAAECGFDDANYFSRAFRKTEGLSPREYRQLW